MLLGEMYVQVVIICVVSIINYVNCCFWIFFQYYCYVGQGVSVCWFQGCVVVVEGYIVWYIEDNVIFVVGYVNISVVYFVMQFCFLYIYVIIYVVVQSCVCCYVNQCVFIVIFF